MQEALRIFGNVFSEGYPDVETGETWVSFKNFFGRTTIFAIPIDIETPDGFHLLDRIVVKTVLPGNLFQLDDSLIVETNTMATTGALMTDPDTGELVIVSSVTFLDCDGADDGLLGLYVPLVIRAAMFHPYCLLSRDILEQLGAPHDLPQSDEPSAWGQEDFEQAAMALRQAGIFSNAGSTGLAAEFPWDDGGISWVTGHETSLLTFESEMRHPSLGNGLFFKLELPDAYSEDELVALVHHLNRLEVTGADVPPFFGAWCSKLTTGRIAFVGFLPNLAYWPGSVNHISAWLKIRAQYARAAIGNFVFPDDESRQLEECIAALVE
jgi:hypothetical protein